MTTLAIRNKLYDYIKIADDKKVKAIYTMLENDIVENTEWWNESEFVTDLNKRMEDYDKGLDKGYSMENIQNEILVRKRK